MISVIEEGKKESSNLLNKFFGNDEILKTEVWNIDQTPSKGDVPYIIRFLNEDDSNLDLIKKYFLKYYSFKNRNLKVQTPQQFQTFIKWTEHLDNIEALDKLKNSPKKETSFENTDEDKIAEDSDVVIYKGDSQDRCIKYGRGYTFCIARSTGGNMYNSYRLAKHSSFYFIFFKKIPKTDIHHIMVLDKTKDGFQWTFADNDTKDVSWSEIISKFPVLEKYENLFLNNPLSEDEKNILEFLKEFKTGYFGSGQNLEKFIEVPTNYKIAFLKSGETLIDEIYSYLENNKLWDLINEYASVGPNLTDIQVESFKNKGGSILKNYLKNRENNISQLIEDGLYEFNKLDLDVDYVKNAHEKQYKNAQGRIELLKKGYPMLDFSGLTFLFKLPDGIPENINGYVNFSKCNLTSLSGAPKSVDKDFDCSNNRLASLEGAPESVGGSFLCHSNRLTSLKGAPKFIKTHFDCSNNNLTSLEGAPQVVKLHCDCSNNILASLNGAPRSVGGSFFCSYNELTSLDGAPESVGGGFFCDGNPVKFTEEDIINAMDESEKRNSLRAESFKYFFYN